MLRKILVTFAALLAIGGLALSQTTVFNEGVGRPSDAAWTTGNGTIIALLKNMANAYAAAIPTCGSLPLCVTIGGTFPVSNSIGGATGYTFNMVTASANSQVVKNASGTMYEFTIVQGTTTPGSLRFYNSGSSPTCSSSTNLIREVLIQSNATTGGVVITASFPTGLQFTNGISFCFTGDVAGTYTGANWAGTDKQVTLNVAYK